MGARTCSDLRSAAANRSTEEFLAGTVTAVLGVTGVAAGMLMGPDTAPDAAWYERSRYLFVIAPSAVAAVIGVGVVARSQQTDALVDKTTTALSERKNEADRYLYYGCVSARADWSGDRSELTRVEIGLMKENLAAATAAQEAASKAATQGQSAMSVAIDAKATAAKAAQIASASAEATKDLAAATEKLMEAPKKGGSVAPR
jgi:hypothetical protein